MRTGYRWFVVWFLAAGIVRGHGAGAADEPAPPEPDNAPQVFFGYLLGDDFFEQRADFVLAKVIEKKKEPPKGAEMRFALAVVSSYRGKLKEGERITVDGNRPHRISSFGVLPDLPVGSTVLLEVFPTGRAGEYLGGPGLPTPFGIATPKVIGDAEMEDVKQGLVEMRRLIPTDGHGPVPHDEAVKLLGSRRYVLWALGACLLAYEGNTNDIRDMAQAAGTEQATLEQFDWVRYLLTEVVPDKSQAWAREQLDPMLRSFLMTHNPRLRPLEP